MTRLQIDLHGRVLDTWLAQKDGLGPAWGGAAAVSDYALQLRPDQARALADELDAVVTRWMDAHPGDAPADGTELVFVLTDIVPVTDWST
jgi:hypothetical protein